MRYYSLLFRLCAFLAFVQEVLGLQKRCLSCRSRGELGSCGDPFPFNVTDPEATPGIHVVACPSGWCSKKIEGSTGSYRPDDYGAATERRCMQRPPSDFEERCATTTVNYRKVFICFCTGDLCNSALRISTVPLTIVLTILCTIYNLL